MQKHVDLQLSMEELNLVLVALSQLPYVQVHELITRLQADIAPQLVADVAAKGRSNTEAAKTA